MQEVDQNSSVGATIEHLSSLFGSYKAEWLQDSIYDLFSEPSYFPELGTERPCILIGGRGSGKTTTLRCLSYQGQHAIMLKRGEVGKPAFFGFYYRVNRARVTAFAGPELSDLEWDRLFSHYMNLLIAEQWCEFVDWYEKTYGEPTGISSDLVTRVARQFGIAGAISVLSLHERIQIAREDVEIYINNFQEDSRPTLSGAGIPIETIFSGMQATPAFNGKRFFVMLDEYEGFLDYQQVAINTLIKHSCRSYTFKIGVRDLGWRDRSTRSGGELLVSPADYSRIDISERLRDSAFANFALSVCNTRLAQFTEFREAGLTSVREVLPELTERDEGARLGADQLAAEIRKELKLSARERRQVSALEDLDLILLKRWAEHEDKSLASIVREFLSQPDKWNQRFGNYRYSMLFQIRRGKSGIRKYYAGWNTFVTLAGNNIRYLLELVEQSLLRRIREGEGVGPVSSENQTLAAQQVGRNRLMELEGLSTEGARLTRLVLGL